MVGYDIVVDCVEDWQSRPRYRELAVVASDQGAPDVPMTEVVCQPRPYVGPVSTDICDD